MDCAFPRAQSGVHSLGALRETKVALFDCSVTFEMNARLFDVAAMM
jgi:hypothetical protein